MSDEFSFLSQEALLVDYPVGKQVPYNSVE